MTTATKTAKAPNYTPEQTAGVLNAWAALQAAGYDKQSHDEQKAGVEAIATTFGKTARSIVAKLSREGVYKKAEYVGKTGEKPVKKDAHADAIGLVLKLSEADTDSLTKANKAALKTIYGALANSTPITPENEVTVSKLELVAAIKPFLRELDENDQNSLARVSTKVLNNLLQAFQEMDMAAYGDDAEATQG